jgi:TonB family protein
MFKRAFLAATFASCVLVPVGPGASNPDPSRLAYHLRVVRVSGEGAWPGAALGCGSACGKPIVLPSEEAWGTAAQLDGLARALGGERADAVTGYIVLPDANGEASFDVTIYPGDATLELLFQARPVEAERRRSELLLELSASPSAPPLAEVRVIAAPERTVAIAAPSTVDGEWVVLAITALDSQAAEQRASSGAPIGIVEEPLTFPEVIERTIPLYPPQARKERREGSAILQAVIDAEGAVRAVTVLRVPSGSEDFAAAAVEAVQNWRYRPALDPDGQPVPVYFTIKVDFELR